MRMTHVDWVFFAKFIMAALVVFYLKVWFLESSRAGSWRAGHAMLWKKPKKLAADYLWRPLGPHSHRIHCRVFDSTVKLINYHPALLFLVSTVDSG